MPHRLSTEFAGYAFLEPTPVNDQWDGQQLTLQNETSATIPFTPDGSLIFAYQNIAKTNSSGSLLLTSGSLSVPLAAPALTNQLLVYIHNFKGNSLKVSNTTPDRGSIWASPINIQLMGPGLGATPANLPAGESVSLAPGATAQGDADPRWMQLSLTNSQGTKSTIAILGGPQDSFGNNAYLVGVNFPSDTGPPPEAPPPPTPPAGYYATVKSNNYDFQFNWGSGAIFCANFSGSTAGPATLVLRAL